MLWELTISSLKLKKKNLGDDVRQLYAYFIFVKEYTGKFKLKDYQQQYQDKNNDIILYFNCTFNVFLSFFVYPSRCSRFFDLERLTKNTFNQWSSMWLERVTYQVGNSFRHELQRKQSNIWFIFRELSYRW